MASQGHQKLRRNPSPSCLKQGPLKATKSFGLKASPSASPTAQWATDSHRKNRRSPDHRASPDRISPCSPGFKDKGKSRKSPVPIKRTNSLDTITTPYLKGEWPRDPIGPYQTTAALHTLSVASQLTIQAPCPQPISTTTCDKYTQTEENDWEERHDKKHKKSHKRSSSWGNEEKLKEKQKIKARLAKSYKEGSKVTTGTGQVRISPVQGNHAVTSAINQQTKALPILNIPKSPYKIIGSVEGLNQEIEKLVLTRHSGLDHDSDCRLNLTEDTTPDGHRAPVLELLHPGTRNADTQTPSGITEHLESARGLERTDSSTSGTSSTSSSASPALPIIPLGTVSEDSSPRTHSSSTEGSTDKDAKEKNEEGESPNPNKCLFVREPPDGCEKIKIVEENRRASTESSELLFCPIKKSLQNFHIPSHSSAFCPLMKSYVPQPALDLKTVTSPTKDRDC